MTLGYCWNKDEGPCSSNCQAAFCGDSLVWAGEEQYDHGMANNDLLHGD